MAVTNRAAKLAKLHRVAKKHYQVVSPPGDRTVLEHLLYACLLEDSMFDVADEAFARLQQGYFDWNEVRVTTAIELSEVLSCLSDPNEAAVRLKKTLHSMFETHYSFDIDSLRKENLGKAVQKLEGYNGATAFIVSYVAQNGLGGHSIGIDRSVINLMYTVGIIDEKEASKGVVPGLERAVAKNKGVEFFSLVHQLGVAYSSSPFNNDIRAVLSSIDADSKDRFPKRQRKKKPQPKPVEVVAVEPVEKAKPAKATKPAKAAKAGGKAAAKKKGAKPAKPARAAKAAKKKATKNVKKQTGKKVARKAATKKAPKPKPKKTAKKVAKKKTAKKPVRKKVTKKSDSKSASRKLGKKKPR